MNPSATGFSPPERLVTHQATDRTAMDANRSVDRSERRRGSLERVRRTGTGFVSLVVPPHLWASVSRVKLVLSTRQRANIYCNTTHVCRRSGSLVQPRAKWGWPSRPFMHRPGDRWRVRGGAGSKSIAIVSPKFLLAAARLFELRIRAPLIGTPRFVQMNTRLGNSSLQEFSRKPLHHRHDNHNRDFLSKAPRGGTFRYANVALRGQACLARR